MATIHEHAPEAIRSVIINPRGTSGAGKTEFVRRIMARYGWDPAYGRRHPDRVIWRAGRRRPLGYTFSHPLGRRPLFVLGHYERTSGGCDTIAKADGGLDEAFRLADTYAANGHDVLLEGLTLSREVERSRQLGRYHRLHVVRLTTPTSISARNLIARRRASRGGLGRVECEVQRQEQEILDACHKLQPPATLASLAFDEALRRAQELLQLPP